MARGVPTLLGYHGMESRFFDALLGGKNVWELSVLTEHLGPVRGQVHRSYTQEPAGHPRTTTRSSVRPARRSVREFARPGRPCCSSAIQRRDGCASYRAAKVAEEHIAPTVADARFPVNSYALFPDSSSVRRRLQARASTPPPATVTASLASWAPGAMTVKLDGQRHADDVPARRRELVSRLARDGRRQAGAGLSRRRRRCSASSCRRVRRRSAAQVRRRELPHREVDHADLVAPDGGGCCSPIACGPRTGNA